MANNFKNDNDFVMLYVFAFQDGRIDYNEFVAMMHRGNAEMGKRGRKGSSSFGIGFREALPVC